MKLFLIFLFFLISWPRPSQAYLDPGTGSMILQITVGALLAAGYTIKVYWRKIVRFVKKCLNHPV